jgi:S-adenosylmethionine uptake transporter
VKPHHPLAPVLITVLAVALLSVMDGFMKAAALAAGAYSAMVCRGLIGTVLATPLYLGSAGGFPTRAVLKVHALRSTVAAAMALLFFHSLTLLPIAEAIALSFVAPLIALYLAAVMLGEKIAPRAIWASLAGFAGVLVIVAPRVSADFFTESGEGIAALMASAVLYAWNLVLQRRQAQIARPQEIAFFQNLFVLLILGLAIPWFFEWPEVRGWMHIGVSAVLAISASLLMSWAYARAETQVLVPMEYSAFVWAALVGWIGFGEPLGIATVLGAVLIVAACIYATRTTPPEPVVV